MKKILVKNGEVVFADSVQRTDLLIQDGKIAQFGSIQIYDQLVNAQGLYVLPALLDIHYHGLFIFPSPERIEKDLKRMQEMLLKRGVSGFLATFPAMEISRLRECLSALKSGLGKAQAPCARCLGVHLEGPFLNQDAKGAQPESAIIDFDPDSKDMLALLDEGKDLVRIMTFAPEQKYAKQLVRLLVERKIIPSLGHSQASYEQAIEFYELGAIGITHLFNAMSGVHHRQPGLALAGLVDKRFYREVIVDGYHLHPGLVRLIWENSPREKFILVSDFVGDEEPMDEKPPMLNPKTLAGSRLRLIKAVKNLIKFTSATLPQAINCASLYPAKILGENNLGRIELQAEANLLLADEDLNLKAIIFQGMVIEN